jgi:hypothetical protein
MKITIPLSKQYPHQPHPTVAGGYYASLTTTRFAAKARRLGIVGTYSFDPPRPYSLLEQREEPFPHRAYGNSGFRIVRKT